MLCTTLDQRAESTVSIAPRTPMQSALVLQKNQTHETPDSFISLPSLTLGRGSFERQKATTAMPHSQQQSPVQKPMASKSPSKNFERIQLEVQRDGPDLNKENLLSLSLPKHEKQCLELSVALGRPHGGHLPQHNLPAMPGLSKVLPVEVHYTQPGLTPACKEATYGGLCVYPADSQNSLLSSEGGKPSSDAGSKSELATPSSHSSPVQAEMGFHPKHLLPSAFEDQRTTGRKGNHQFDDRTDNVKRLKYTPMKAECTPISLIAVKKEVPESGGGKTTFSEEPQNHVVAFSSTVSEPNGVAYGPNTDARSASFHRESNGLNFFVSFVHAEIPSSLLTVSSGEPSLPLSLEPSLSLPNSAVGKTPVQGSSAADADWGKFLALSATPVVDRAEASTAVDLLPFQQRFKQLQAFLKKCDQADKTDCLQALRSLSAAARSGYAVELETRAIKLSLEEGKEMQRMKLLNVLGRSVDDAGTTPHGLRLPAPGTTAKLKHVSQS